jgi:hypothetical protein
MFVLIGFLLSGRRRRRLAGADHPCHHRVQQGSGLRYPFTLRLVN